MAEDAQIQLGLDVDDAGVAAQIEATLNKAFSGLSGQLGAQLGEIFTKALKGANQFQRGFDDIGDAGKRSFTTLNRAAGAFDETAKGIGDSLRRVGSGLSPSTFSATAQSFNGLIELIERLQREIKQLGAGGLDTEVTRNLTASLRSAANQANVVQQSVARESAISARTRAEAERVGQQDATRLAIAGSKERIVAAQQEGSQTLAAVRSSSAQRVAVIKGITTAVKGMEDVFSRVVSGGSSVLGRSISGISSTLSSIGGALRRSNTDMTQGLSAAVDKRTSIIRSGFSRQETAIRESVTRSQRTVEKFNTISAGGLTGLAAGRSNAANALGIGGLVGGGFAIFNELKSGLTAGADFTAALKVLQAQLQLTSGEMANVRQISLDLGNDLSLPGVSALDAVQAISLLTKQFGALGDQAAPAAEAAAKGVLSLSRATQASAEDAAQIVGASINVFGLAADKATDVADKVAVALANAAGTSTTDFAQAFRQGASTFNQFQGAALGSEEALTEFNAALGILARNGIVGSDAGTSLKQFFLQGTRQAAEATDLSKELAKQAGVTGNVFFDQDGKARRLSEAMGILRKATESMTEEQKNAALGVLFGSDAVRAANALVGTSAEDYLILISRLQRQGAAAEIAAAQNAGLRGALDALSSTIETQLILAYETFNIAAGNAVLVVANFVNELASGEGVYAMARDALKGIAIGLGGLIALKGAIEVVQLLGVVFGALLTPMGLVIAAVALAGGALGVLTQTNEGVASGFETVKEAIGGFFGEIKDGFVAMVAAFQANDPDQTTSGIAGAFERLGTQARILFNFIGDEIIPVIGEIAAAIKTNFVGAFEVASNFLRQQVIPGLERFAEFITGTVAPAVQDGLAVAFDVAAGAITSFWETVQPVLQPAIEGIGSLVSGIGDLVASDPVAALGGIGAVLAASIGGFAIGGPLGAVIGGLGAGVAALFATGLNENLVDALSGIGETIAGAFSNLGGAISSAVSTLFGSIDFGALIGSAFEASGFARDIGAVLGRLVSSPQLVAALAGLAALAATFAGQFLIGFGQGVIENVPALASLIGDALKAALEQGLSFALDNPTLLIGGLVAFFAGRGFLNLFKTAGTQAGTGLKTGLFSSFRQNAFGGVFASGAGGVGGGFFTALFGGPNGIESSIRKETDKAAASAQRGVQKMNSILQTAGRGVGSGLQTGSGFAKNVTDGFNKLAADVGPKGLLGLKIRGGFQAAVDSIKSVSLGPVKQFFNDMNVSAGQAIKTVGKTVATGLAGAFAGFQTGQALSGQGIGTQLLGVGGLALGLGAINPVMGVAAGAAGVLGIAFGNMGKGAEEAKARIAALSKVIQDAGGDMADAAGQIGQKVIEELQKNVDPEVLSKLIGAGFDLSKVVNQVTVQGRDVMDALNEQLDTKRIQALAGDIDDEQFFKFLDTLRDNLNALPKAAADAKNAIDLSKQFDKTATATGNASTAVKTYTDRLQILNDEPIPPTVSGIEGALNKIPAAADAARLALDNFLQGPAAGGGALQTQLDKFTLNLPTLQAKVDEINVPDLAPLLKNALSNQFSQDIQTDLRGTVSVAISSGQITPTIEGVQGFLELLRGQVQTALDQGAISADVAAAVTAQIDSLSVNGDLPTLLQQALDTGVLSPTITVTPVASIPPEAMADFKGSIATAISGATTGPAGFGMSRPGGAGVANAETVSVPITLDPDITVNSAGAAAAGAVVAAAFVSSIVANLGSAGAAGAGLSLAAVVQMGAGGGLASGAGGGLAQRFAAGIVSGIGGAVAAARALGNAASTAVRTSADTAFAAGISIAQGLARGVQAGTGAAVAAARAMAQAVTNAAKAVLDIASPSGVFEDIGHDIGAGLSQGIADSEGDITDALSGVLDNVIGRATTLAQATAGLMSQLFDTLLPSSRGDVAGAGNVSNLALTRTRGALETLSTDLQQVFDQSAVDLWNAVAAGPGGDARQRLIAAQFQGFGLSNTNLANNSALGAQNTSGFLDVAEKIRSFISEAVNAGEPLAGVIGQAQQYRDELLNVVAAYGISTDQASNLFQTLGLLDPQLQQFIDQAQALRTAAATPSTPTAAATAAADAEKAARDAEISALKEQLRLAAIGGGGVNVNVYPPFGDPEAIGLGAANRVAVLLAG